MACVAVVCIGCHDEPNVASRDAMAETSVVSVVDATAPEPTAMPIVDASPFADASLADMVSDAIRLLDQIGDIIAVNINDCDAMGAKLDAFRLKHLDGVAEVSAIYDPERKNELHALQPQFRARFKSAWGKVRPGIKKCARAPTMKQVIHDIWGDSDWGPVPDGGD